MRSIVLSIAVILSIQCSIGQRKVGKSPWGADDQIGTLNMMTDASKLSVLQSIGAGKTYDLGVEYFVGMPGFHFMGDPRYQYWLTHTPHGTLVDNPNYQGEVMNKKVSYTSDAISMLTHSGTHIDALNHFGLYGEIWNGFPVDKYLGDKGWKKAGAETIPPIIARGILLDVAGFKNKTVLDKGYRISKVDLMGTVQKQKITIKKGDVVLIRTGQASHYDNAEKYLDAYPGVSLDAVKWLVEQKHIMVLGADNLGLEAFPSEDTDNWVPVHSYLLAEKGVMFLEQLNLEEIAEAKVYEFAFIASSLKLRGASGSPLRPIALPLVTGSD
ncbi:cyclase family protein [Flagellimonas sp.]|uniref:cyclase family protein n=1 Tax=Flagellimonas sp. TaxID=2058762 RepID=UPI003C79850E